MGDRNLEIDEKTYETMVELLNSVKIIQDYLNDDVVKDSSRHLSAVFKMLNAVSSTDLLDILERAVQDPELDKALLNPPKKGLTGTIKSFGDEDFQRGLGIVISLLSAMGRASKDLGAGKK